MDPQGEGRPHKRRRRGTDGVDELGSQAGTRLQSHTPQFGSMPVGLFNLSEVPLLMIV
jgi:hypothetical protein